MKLKDNLGFLLADVSRTMRRAFQQHLEHSLLTLAQARALIHISRNEGVRQIDLAELLEVQPITLARLIDQLAMSGLVERRPDPADRRAHQVFLTPAAEAHLLEIEQVAVKIRKEAVRGLNKEQIATVFLALEKMRANLTSKQSAGE